MKHSRSAVEPERSGCVVDGHAPDGMLGSICGHGDEARVNASSGRRPNNIGQKGYFQEYRKHLTSPRRGWQRWTVSQSKKTRFKLATGC